MLKTLLAFVPVRGFRALGCGFAGPCHGPIGNLDLMPGDFWWDSGVFWGLVMLRTINPEWCYLDLWGCYRGLSGTIQVLSLSKPAPGNSTTLLTLFFKASKFIKVFKEISMILQDFVRFWKFCKKPSKVPRKNDCFVWEENIAYLWKKIFNLGPKMKCLLVFLISCKTCFYHYVQSRRQWLDHPERSGTAKLFS